MMWKNQGIDVRFLWQFYISVAPSIDFKLEDVVSMFCNVKEMKGICFLLVFVFDSALL